MERISKELKIKNQTVRNYLEILEETFIAGRLTPFFHTARSEIRKMPKIYFFDTGVRNFAKYLRDFPPAGLFSAEEKGKLWENFIFNELWKAGFADIHFWRTKDDAEVDFVVRKKGSLFPIEVKSGSFPPGRLSQSFHSFLQKYKPRQAFVVNTEYQGVEEIDKSKIHFVFPYELTERIAGL